MVALFTCVCSVHNGRTCGHVDIVNTCMQCAQAFTVCALGYNGGPFMVLIDIIPVLDRYWLFFFVE